MRRDTGKNRFMCIFSRVAFPGPGFLMLFKFQCRFVGKKALLMRFGPVQVAIRLAKLTIVGVVYVY